MKRLWIVCVLPIFLLGCGAAQTFETVADELIAPVMASPGEILVRLPESAAAPVWDEDGQQLYLCEGYEILLENRSAGDLRKTIREISGFDPEELTVMKTGQGGTDRYEFVWTCAGEQGQRLGRAVILDDGNYHYCLSVLRDPEAEADWQAIFSSFTLV